MPRASGTASLGGTLVWHTDGLFLWHPAEPALKEVEGAGRPGLGGGGGGQQVCS